MASSTRSSADRADGVKTRAAMRVAATDRRDVMAEVYITGSKSYERRWVMRDAEIERGTVSRSWWLVAGRDS